MNDTENNLVRICPICGKHNLPDESFCVCGTLLADVDFTHIGAKPSVPGQPEPATEPVSENLCPHPDCAQPNPHGLSRCVYCNRELTQPAQNATDNQLLLLPPSLRAQFNVLEVLPAAGLQADLLLVETKQRDKRMIKLYRKGIKPDWQVLKWVSQSANNNLVRFFSYGEEEDTAFEVMEYCAEGNLRNLLDSGPQADQVLRRLIEQLSGALTALHEQHILHRDLKPENILLRATFPLQTALTDFGTSTLKMATQYFTGGARTVYYAAPEVLTGVLDEKSDWWSLGMILLEAITGRHPYAGLSEQVALHQLATQSVEVKDVFDDAMRMLCRGLLLRNPKKRWGAANVTRWLAKDQSLAMPEDAGEGAAVRHYTLVRCQCLTRIDLALALARYWEEGKKDLMRGVVLNWVEQDLRDFNLARDIHDALIRHDLSDDARLLRVIVSALPGIPPIWKGRIISRETLARSATQAVDDNMEALGWLLSIYKDDVLHLLGECGNADMAKISVEWNQGVEAYRRLWERAKTLECEGRCQSGTLSGGAPDVDYMLYLAPIRMNVPALNKILPDLVLALYVPAFLTSAKNVVLNACTGMAESCTWYTKLVNETREKSDIFWSVLQRLLPFAMEDAKNEQNRQQQAVRNSDMDVASVIARIDRCCKQLARLEDIEILNDWEPDQLRDEIAKWIEFSLWLKGLDHDNPTLRNLTEKLDVLTLRVVHVQNFMDEYQQISDTNKIWLKPSRLMFFAVLASGVLAYSYFAAVMLAILAGCGIYWRLRQARISREEGLKRVRRMMESVRQYISQWLAGNTKKYPHLKSQSKLNTQEMSFESLAVQAGGIPRD